VNYDAVDISCEKRHSQGNTTSARLGYLCAIGWIFAIGMLSIPTMCLQAAGPIDRGKPRVIILTDIGGDPDDAGLWA
jgi:hypothetical protein